MKILFIVPYYKPAYIYGGPIVVISLLAENLVLSGHDVTVYTSSANGNEELNAEHNKELIVDGVKVFYFDRLTKNNTYIAPKLWRRLSATVSDFDVVHIHTWWNFLVLGAALICRRHGVKPIISPHGMLSDYIFYKRHPLAKKGIHALIGKVLLKNSSLHVSTQMEMDESLNVIPDWQGEIIPNMIKLSEKKYVKHANDEFSIGFLSRVDPKKGLDILIRAVALVEQPCKLLIAGSGNTAYVNTLKKLTANVGISDRVAWVGWKNGEEKFKFLSEIDLFALTSHSENFAIVVIEALSVGTPVLISNNVGLYSYIQDTNFGCVTDMDITNVAKHISSLILDKEKLVRINNEAPLAIEHEYEEKSLADQYVKFYRSTKPTDALI